MRVGSYGLKMMRRVMKRVMSRAMRRAEAARPGCARRASVFGRLSTGGFCLVWASQKQYRMSDVDLSEQAESVLVRRYYAKSSHPVKGNKPHPKEVPADPKIQASYGVCTAGDLVSYRRDPRVGKTGTQWSVACRKGCSPPPRDGFGRGSAPRRARPSCR